ncbi:hypothetical protein GCM10009809_15140 [Isoptericola hypogeus]|uniref:HNH nuclease domain-containing protein n=1 Tax=Isoptericola hypogeus TaxID=300179 RepID=A0ABP4VBI7_9MICO
MLDAALGRAADEQTAANAALGRRTVALAEVLAATETAPETMLDLEVPRVATAPAIRRSSVAHRALAAEVACALGIGEASASTLLSDAQVLTRRARATLDALCTGRISYRHAAVLVEAVADLPAHAVAEIEAVVLHRAPEVTAAKFGALARAARDLLHPVPAEVRHEAAKLKADVWVDDGKDGMSWLTAHLPAPVAHAVHDRLTRTATRAKTGGDPRGIGQLRAATLTALLLDDTGGSTGSTEASASQHAADTFERADIGECADDDSAGAAAANAARVEAQSTAGSSPDTSPGAASGAPPGTEPLGTAGATPPSPPGAAQTPSPGGMQSGENTAPTASPIPDSSKDALTSGLPDNTPSCAPPDPLATLARSVRPVVHVTVPITTLTGTSEDSAILDGAIPLDPETARQLAAHAPTLRRILTDPVTGAMLTVDRRSYVVPADLRAFLTQRDVTCRFPGCRIPARSCDVDHTLAWVDGGPTDAQNLAHLCRRHHTLKHESRWAVEQLDHGVLAWTSPRGRTYLTTPGSAVHTLGLLDEWTAEARSLISEPASENPSATTAAKAAAETRGNASAFEPATRPAEPATRPGPPAATRPSEPAAKPADAGPEPTPIADGANDANDAGAPPF